MPSEPKVLFLDIESSPNKCYTWGLWGQNISIEKIIEPQRMICWAAKWEGEEEIIWSRHHDPYMLEHMHDLLDKADFVVHYNGYTFDIPMINAEFVQAKMSPPSPYKQIDLYKVASKQFRFPSNKLDYVSQALGIGEKIKHSGFQLWLDCEKGLPEAWEMMEKYNKQDVRLLEELYQALLPWIPYHPHRALNDLACPSCGSDKLVKRGTYLAKTRTYQRYVCKVCGAWSRSVKSTSDRAQVTSVRA